MVNFISSRALLGAIPEDGANRDEPTKKRVIPARNINRRIKAPLNNKIRKVDRTTRRIENVDGAFSFVPRRGVGTAV